MNLQTEEKIKLLIWLALIHDRLPIKLLMYRLSLLIILNSMVNGNG
jgi:hypothetical protein